MGVGAEPQPDPREVQRAFWVPLARLRETARGRMWRRIGFLPLPFPFVDLEGETLWGLTLQMVDALLRRL